MPKNSPENSTGHLEDAKATFRRAGASLPDALAYVGAIVDTVREPLVVLDAEQRIVTASRAFYQTFDVAPEDTEGRFLYDLGNRQWDIPQLRNLMQKVLGKDENFRDFEVAHSFPTLGWRVMLLNARKLWLRDNHSERVLLAIEDITERKRIEEELLRSNEDLQRFAYVAAHDLRSPLNGTLGLLQLLARRAKDMLGEEESSILALSIQNVQRLQALMQDILTYSEVDNSPQKRRLVPLEEPLRIALVNLQHHIEISGAAIYSTALPTVSADRTQMVLVFQNLIGNAIKYRREAEPLKIQIEVLREGNDWRFAIIDNGQGFEADYAALIFEPFKRLQSPEIPGSGIGLATCKRIIERLNGRIWATSAPGAGSTFFFTMPFLPA